MNRISNPKRPKDATGVIVFADGQVLWGRGFGAETKAVGEVCFNTSLTGYQEVMTDPSYAGQIVTFTFPHIGNVGTNPEDLETTTPASRGMIVREDVTEPSNWRSQKHLDEWMKSYNLPGISGIDTRALTRRIRDHGAPTAVICHNAAGDFDMDALLKEAQEWPGLEGMDLAKDVSCTQSYSWKESLWDIKGGYGTQNAPQYKVVAMDFGAKRNILRCLANAGFDVTVVPATASAEDILSHKPDGVFLSNGPGDPSATASYVSPVLKTLMDKNVPIFGICLGHQLLALTLGGQTRKMHLGHRGGNHPVKDLETGKVEITSQNHGFEVLESSLPKGVKATHVSLFDGSNEGLKMEDKPVFSVQYHPEASPGPNDSYYLFERFRDMIADHKKKKAA